MTYIRYKTVRSKHLNVWRWDSVWTMWKAPSLHVWTCRNWRIEKWPVSNCIVWTQTNFLGITSSQPISSIANPSFQATHCNGLCIYERLYSDQDDFGQSDHLILDRIVQFFFLQENLSKFEPKNMNLIQTRWLMHQWNYFKLFYDDLFVSQHVESILMRLSSKSRHQ